MKATSSVPGGEHALVLSDGGSAGDAGVLVLPEDGIRGDRVIGIAAAIAGSSPLYVLDADTADGSAAESERSAAESMIDAQPVRIEGPLTDRAVRSLTTRYGISTLVTDSRRYRPSGGAVTVDFEDGPDVVTVEVAEHFETISSILAPVAGGPHVEAMLDVARALARWNDAWIELFHVVDPGASRRERDAVEELFAACVDQLGDFDEYDTWAYEAADPASAIAEQSPYYDATVLGAPQKGRLREFVAGSTTGDVRSEAANTVLTVRNGKVSPSRLERWIGTGT